MSKYTGETLARFTVDGAAELRFNNNVKFVTKTDGVDITGEVQCDSLDVDGGADITGNVVLHNHLDLGDDNHIRWRGDDPKIITTVAILLLTKQEPASCLLGHMIELTFKNTGETCAQFIADGAVNLYHDGTIKFSTKSDGIDVAGEVQCDSLDVDGTVDITGNVTLHANLILQDNDILKVGSSDDLQVKHDGTDSFITNLTGDLHVRANGDDLHLRSADDI